MHPKVRTLIKKVVNRGITTSRHKLWDVANIPSSYCVGGSSIDIIYDVDDPNIDIQWIDYSISANILTVAGISTV